jgi:hypothetical protein
MLITALSLAEEICVSLFSLKLVDDQVLRGLASYWPHAHTSFPFLTRPRVSSRTLSCRTGTVLKTAHAATCAVGTKAVSPNVDLC